MDALSRLLTLNAPQGSIDKLPVRRRLAVAARRWRTIGDSLAYRYAGRSATGNAYRRRHDAYAGKVVILPQNSAHRLRQSGESPTHIVCGSLRLHTTSRYFLTALPEVLCLAPPPHSPASIWINATILLLQQESERHLPGADVLYSQQCATLFTLAVRDWLSQAGTAKSVLNLLLHPRLGRVILHMLETPAHPWTVETLAQRVHMSRASFAQLFRDVSATTPLAVLTTLRLQIAAQTLSREVLPVMVIAESVGYASESSFHKAFVREFGCTPGEYRKRVSALGR